MANCPNIRSLQITVIFPFLSHSPWQPRDSSGTVRGQPWDMAWSWQDLFLLGHTLNFSQSWQWSWHCHDYCHDHCHDWEKCRKWSNKNKSCHDHSHDHVMSQGCPRAVPGLSRGCQGAVKRLSLWVWQERKNYCNTFKSF